VFIEPRIGSGSLELRRFDSQSYREVTLTQRTSALDERVTERNNSSESKATISGPGWFASRVQSTSLVHSPRLPFHVAYSIPEGATCKQRGLIDDSEVARHASEGSPSGSVRPSVPRAARCHSA
jgi:hypothetical protein